jgi:hypothetical protein
MRVIGADHSHDVEGDGERRGEYRWVPVLSPAQIRALETGQVLVMRRGLHTLIGYAPLITDRTDWQPVNLRDAVPGPHGIALAVDDLETLLEPADHTRTSTSGRSRVRAGVGGLRAALAALAVRLGRAPTGSGDRAEPAATSSASGARPEAGGGSGA